MSSNTDYVVILSGTTYLAALIAQGVLEEAGIPSRILRKDTLSCEFGDGHRLLNESQLLVPRANLEAALEAIITAWSGLGASRARDVASLVRLRDDVRDRPAWHNRQD